MDGTHILGLDFGTESARAVRIDLATSRSDGQSVRSYRHGVMTKSLPDGQILPPGYALQVAGDYLEAAEDLLRELGSGRRIASIGIDFTASSPMPALADGTPLSDVFPDRPHAYVKLWKHATAQCFADRMNAGRAAFADNLTVSGEGMLAKAAELSNEAPDLWERSQRFIEAGDWLVWRLTGVEARSLDFASYKANYRALGGYPAHVVPGLESRLGVPVAVGSAAGRLTAGWRERTGISGSAIIAVAAIDSHAVLPAVRGARPHVLVGSLGTSAGYIATDDRDQPVPEGLEGAAFGAALPGLWCCEAGQAAFGDLLTWFVRTFPMADEIAESFDGYNRAAAGLAAEEPRPLALDWFGGSRVPFRDTSLSGLLVGLTLRTTGPGLYRALVESLCFGARSIVDRVLHAGVLIDDYILTGGLARSNEFVVQTMADVIGQSVHVPAREQVTAIGAAIHGAVAAGVSADFAEGSARFGSADHRRFLPNPTSAGIYDRLYREYRSLSSSELLTGAMRRLRTANTGPAPPALTTDDRLEAGAT